MAKMHSMSMTNPGKYKCGIPITAKTGFDGFCSRCYPASLSTGMPTTASYQTSSSNKPSFLSRDYVAEFKKICADSDEKLKASQKEFDDLINGA